MKQNFSTKAIKLLDEIFAILRLKKFLSSVIIASNKEEEYYEKTFS